MAESAVNAYAIANWQAASAHRRLAGVVPLRELRHEAVKLCAELLTAHDPSLSPLGGYLHARLRWGLASWIRKELRRRNMTAYYLGRRTKREPVAFEDASDLLDERRTVESVRMAVALLPLKLREVIERCELGDEMLCTVAAERGVAKSTVGRQRQKAMRLMRRQLREVEQWPT